MASNNPKNADWYGTGLGIALDTAVGDIFYVSESGLDTNDGLTPLTPRLTITAAHALCTAGDNDYIIVLDYNIRHDGEGWPIELNKSDVHLIGSLHTGILAPSHFVVGTGAFDTIRIGADRIEIAGLSLGAVDDAHACIVTDGIYYAQIHVHHCDFSHTTTGQDGIVVAAGQTWNWEIDHCRFGQDTVGLIRDGIRHVEQAVRMHIHDNVFYVRDPGHGVFFDSANMGGIIERNTFKVPGVSTGEAITIETYNTVGCTINNNWAMSGAEVPAFNPYRDISTTANHWGLNYMGLTPTFPVCV